VSAVAEVYILAKYTPKMRGAIEKKWEPFLQTLARGRVGAGFCCPAQPRGFVVSWGNCEGKVALLAGNTV
jgi:hypothetical protein